MMSTKVMFTDWSVRFRIAYRAGLALLAGAIIALGPMAIAAGQSASSTTGNARVDTGSAGLNTKIGPGELLPVSVRLANFGAGQRVDVLVHYNIVQNTTGKVVSSVDETVAVETTDNFVKMLQVPYGVPGGKYTVRASITYKGQLVPATTSFTFLVEPKILGVFRSEFYLYGSVALITGFVLVLAGHAIAKRQRSSRLNAFDYNHMPRGQRVFYELVSDTIMNMRLQVGREAIDIAATVPGLEIDDDGRVLKLSGPPSKIVADLVAKYESSLGKRVSFSFRGGGSDTKAKTK